MDTGAAVLFLWPVCGGEVADVERTPMRTSGEDRPEWYPAMGGDHGRAGIRRFPGGFWI